MRVLICGDRNWQDAKLIYRVMKPLTKEDTVIEGEGHGADTIARVIAELRDIPIEAFPADWCDFGAVVAMDGTAQGCAKQHTHHGKKAWWMRNQAMISATPEICWAFHDDLSQSKGTRMMIAIALGAGIPTKLYSHNHPQGEEITHIEI